MQTLSFTVVIPARMRSTRLPGKMLADVAGKPLVAWVAERARSSGATDVVIATDHPDIERAVRALGWRACMTSADHATGTDRIAEAVAALGYGRDEIVVNVQGDEPLIDPSLIRAVAQELARHPDADIATAAHPIDSADAFFDPNVVKVVLDTRGIALYFSRAPIPYARDAFAHGRTELAPGPGGAAPHRHLRLPRALPARVREPRAHRRRSASRRSSSCARWGTDTASPWRSGDAARGRRGHPGRPRAGAPQARPGLKPAVLPASGARQRAPRIMAG